ncbi:MAG TPA: low temperature requirement protein A [Novosphingobium sp.]|nr:low temperature requirement protein A [Novosphingobium sp.]
MPPEPPTPQRGGFGAAVAAVNRQAAKSLLRNHGGGKAAVSNLELFFDLVFVFAVTQLSHFLLEQLDLLRALQTLILFFAVWWAWIFTTWATNWIEPDRAPNRLMLGAVMLASLAMSCAIPEAYSDGGLAFAVAYVAVQVGRTLYVSYALGEWRPETGNNMRRATLWFAIAGVLWIAGGWTEDVATRMALWIAALVIEYIGPAVFFWVPRLGRSRPEEWAISGSHMAERTSLFIIIALGEGLVITGATFAQSRIEPAQIAAFLNAFLSSFAMWWIYFDLGAKRGAQHIEQHDRPGLVARVAFTYWHIPIVAGIIVLAVADELLLAHPMDPVHFDFLIVLVGGMVLFVGGTMVFKKITSGKPWYPLSHGIGMWLILVLGLWGWLLHPPALALAFAGTAIFALIGWWEWVSFHGGFLERMESRDWRIAKVLRARIDRARIAREAKEAAARIK